MLFSWTGLFYSVIILLFSSLYHFFFEVFNKGQSPGKMLLKIRVIDLKGGKPDVESLFVRWLFRNIDVTLSFGFLSFLFINSSRFKQRLGGVLSKTLVIKLLSDELVSLDSILSLNKDTRKIKYPNVRRFDDKDMLLVKQALNRYKGKKSESNLNVIEELFEKVTQGIGVNPDDVRDKVKFLETVLVEYILITR